MPGQSPGGGLCPGGGHSLGGVPVEDFSATPLLRFADGWIKVELHPPGQSPGGRGVFFYKKSGADG
jgi:hypothetical protein